LTDCALRAWSPLHLEAEVSGRRSLGNPAVHIKAVTYHQLSVTAEGTTWTAHVFFDI